METDVIISESFIRDSAEQMLRNMILHSSETQDKIHFAANQLPLLKTDALLFYFFRIQDMKNSSVNLLRIRYFTSLNQAAVSRLSAAFREERRLRQFQINLAILPFFCVENSCLKFGDICIRLV